MKKVLTLLTAFCLLFSLAACGGAGTTTASGSASENGQDTGLTMSWTPVEGVVSRKYEHYESSQAFFGETYTDSRDTEYGYDAAGNQLYVRDVDADGYQNENVFTYDADGNMLTWICSNSEEGEYSRYIYEYVNGLLVKETDYSEAFGNGIMSYEYDGKGNCIKIITSDLNGNVESIEETTYNENGDMLTDIYNESDGSEKIFTFVYDGLLLMRQDMQVTYPEDGESYGYRVEYEYDADGNKTKETETADDGSLSYTVYKYDDAGNLIYQQYVSDGFGYEESFEYNDNGDVVHSLQIDNDGYTSEYFYEFDSQYRVIKSEEKTGDGSNPGSVYTTTYRYE